MYKNNHKTEEPQPQKKGDHHREDIKRKRGDHLGRSSKRNKGARSKSSSKRRGIGEKTVFLRSFTISKRLSLGLVASARILRRSVFDLFADEEEVLLVFRNVVFRYCFCLQSEDVERPFGSIQLFGKSSPLVRDK